jgi:hypothetical protein
VSLLWEAAKLNVESDNRRLLAVGDASLVSELRNHRNNRAHQQAFSADDDAYSTLDSARRLLTAASASQADESRMRGDPELQDKAT